MTLAVPPRVPGHPILGNLPDYRRDPLAFGRSVAAEYGDVVGLRVLNRRLMLLAHPEHVHQVLVRDADKFHKSPVYRIFLGRALGEGLLTSDGDLWRRQRRLAQPAFHHGRIQSYAETMVEYAGAAAARVEARAAIVAVPAAIAAAAPAATVDGATATAAVRARKAARN